MGTDASTPPYPNDALRWVAFEVRYPVLEELSTPGPSAEFHDRIRSVFPVREEQREIGLTVGASGASSQQVVKHRFLTRDRLMSATVSRDALTFETTSYPGWTSFRDQFSDVLRALAESRIPDGLLRIGLRYIDEIRVPSPVESMADWADWVSPQLAAPLRLREEAPTGANIILQYGIAPGYVTLFRAVPQPEGRTVEAEGPLRVPFETPAGPYFLLDTDSSWADPERQVPEFSVSDIIEIAEKLHVPCKELFEASVGERFRSEVLERPREEGSKSE